MEVLYKNAGRPYEKSKELFSDAADNCRFNHMYESEIGRALDCPLELQHAELIACVPSIFVKYYKDQRRLEEVVESYPKLFSYCENVVQQDMQHKLMERKEIPTEKSQNVSRKIKFLLFGIFAGLLTLISIIGYFLMFPPTEPMYSCANLSENQLQKLLNSTVDFQGVPVIFGDLFKRNSAVCKNLTETEVTTMLKIFQNDQLKFDGSIFYRNFTAEENEQLRRRSPKDQRYFTMDDIAYLEVMEINLNESIKEHEEPDLEDNVYMKYMGKKFGGFGIKVSGIFSSSCDLFAN